MVSLSHVGNLDGIATPVKEAAKIAKDFGAMVCIDGASIYTSHEGGCPRLGIDFMAFSIHKMMGPSGMGGLWAEWICSKECVLSIQAEVLLIPHIMIH